MGQLRRQRILRKQPVVRYGRSAAVHVLVRDGNQRLVEERIALTGDLYPGPRGSHGIANGDDFDLLAAGGGIDADDLLIGAQFAHGNFQGHHVNVESSLRVLAGRAQLKQIKDCLNVAVETVIALARKGSVTARKTNDGLRGVMIEFGGRRHAIARGICPVVALIIFRGGNSLIVGWHDARAEQRFFVRAVWTMNYLGHGVGLRQILIRVVHVGDHPEIGLEDGLVVFVFGLEPELVAQVGLAGVRVVAERDVNLVEHVVIEVVFVRPDARLFKRINSERDVEIFLSGVRADEGIDIRGVGRRIERDQRRVHVTARVPDTGHTGD